MRSGSSNGATTAYTMPISRKREIKGIVLECGREYKYASFSFPLQHIHDFRRSQDSKPG